MVNTIWSILPAILAIGMVLITRRVMLSLGVGIVSAAFLLADFQLKETAAFTWNAFMGVFVEDGSANLSNIFILMFILMLGVLTAIISMMGGTQAFGEWMIKRVKTRAGAQIMTMILGIVVFIDDYFNALTVGQVARPITDKHRVSRAKLSYIVDSTSAPVSIVSPISSWGAYIIGLIGTVLSAQKLTEYNAFTAFIQMIPMNLYVWAALGVVLIVSLRGIDFGPMKTHEKRAMETGKVLIRETNELANTESNLPTNENGRVKDLALPLIILFTATLISIFLTGFQGVVSTGEATTFMNILGNADVPKSLVLGGTSGLVISLFLFFNQSEKNGLIKRQHAWLGALAGLKSMIPSSVILIFAWTIGSLIDQLQTGTYLANLVLQANLNVIFLPAMLFILAGFMAFSTGTSWGAFGILLPIAGQIATATEPSLILPMMAAVLSGSVFGDHCSPISDTTILSAAGSGCHPIDHVTTQMPYAILAAVIAFLGYIAMGLSGSTIVGLSVVIAGLCLILIKKGGEKIEVDKEAIAK